MTQKLYGKSFSGRRLMGWSDFSYSEQIENGLYPLEIDKKKNKTDGNADDKDKIKVVKSSEGRKKSLLSDSIAVQEFVKNKNINKKRNNPSKGNAISKKTRKGLENSYQTSISSSSQSKCRIIKQSEVVVLNNTEKYTGKYNSKSNVDATDSDCNSNKSNIGVKQESLSDLYMRLRDAQKKKIAIEKDVKNSVDT
jgi:hypothetical protein